MNELLFCIQILAVSISAFVARRMGEMALVSLVSLLAVLANLFVTQQILLFGWNATSSEPLAVGVALSLNLLQESFGKSAARRAILISTFCVGCCFAFSLLHCLYTPSPFDQMHDAFLRVLTPSFRISVASAATYALVQLVDVAIFALLRARWQGGRFTLRLIICLAFSQFLDTVLFGFLGLYGIVESLTQVLSVSLCIKAITIPFMTILFSRQKQTDDIPV